MENFPSVFTVILSSACVYLFVVVAFRIFGKKELAQLSLPDLVFVLLISNAVQNAMVGSDTSLLGGLVAASTLFLVNILFKKLVAHSVLFKRWVEGEPIVLVYNGRVQDRNLYRNGVSVNELKEAVREHGVSDLSKVNLAMLEVDGNISVLTDDFQSRSVQPYIKKKRKHRKLY